MRVGVTSVVGWFWGVSSSTATAGSVLLSIEELSGSVMLIVSCNIIAIELSEARKIKLQCRVGG